MVKFNLDQFIFYIEIVLRVPCIQIAKYFETIDVM